MKLRSLQCLLLSAALFSISFSSLKAQPAVTWTPKNVSCNGSDNASMTINVTNGPGNYRYICYDLKDGNNNDTIGPTTSTNAVFSNLKPGPVQQYVFTAEDMGTGLLTGTLWTFTQPNPLTASYTSTNIACYDAYTGTITISGAAGGSGQYDYTVNGTNWLTTGTFTGLHAGTYHVRVRDRNNTDCVLILNDNLQLTENGQLNASIASSNSTCYSVNNGSITISGATGGSGSGYQYTITGSAPWTGATSYSGLAPGTYNVIMRDQAVPTCTRVLNGALVLTQPVQLAVNVSINKGLTCHEGADGELIANVSGGTPTYTYDWYKYLGGWVSMGQHNPIATGIDSGRYQVRVNDSHTCGLVTAGIFFIPGAAFAGDSIPPYFKFDSASVVNTCAGQTNGSITIYAHGGVSPLKYSITTGGASGYQPANLFSGLSAGSYQAWAMDKRGCKKGGVNKTVGTTPISAVSVSIVSNAPGGSCPGSPVVFTATPVNGGATPVYQWYLNSTPAGTNSATYTNSSLVSGDQVYVVLTSSLRCTTGNPATSNVLTAAITQNTSITSQPTGVTQCAGTTASFTVAAGGTAPFTYIWQKLVAGVWTALTNGGDVSGATSTNLQIANIDNTDAGDYRVIVHSACGADVTSATATLTVNAATSITTQPSAVTQCTGITASFSVAANGTVPITYQWQKLIAGVWTALTNGGDVSGATATNLQIANTDNTDAGSYRVIVHSNCGADVTSATATLTVNPATSITSQPTGLTQCTGTTASFTVAAGGTAPITYQWQKLIAGVWTALTNGGDVSGTTSTNLQIANIDNTDAGDYRVIAHSACGTDVTSSSATLVVNAATSITTQPTSITQCVTTTASFTVAGNGTAPITYQWQKLIAGVWTALTDGGDVSGTTSTNLQISNIDNTDAGSYRVIIHSNCGTDATSVTVTLTVNPATAITTQPTGLTQCAGTTASFTVAGNGTAPITYQWQKLIAGIWTALTNGGDISGATATNLQIANIDNTDAGDYRVIVHSNCGADVTSATATLAVNAATSITTQPTSVTQCVTTTALFSVAGNGTAPITYQWQKLIAGVWTALTNGGDISGATATNLQIANIDNTDAGSYRVIVHSNCGADVTSSTVTLTVNPATSITSQPTGLTQCAGTLASFTVAANGTAPITYQWQKLIAGVWTALTNGGDVSGATATNLQIANIDNTDAGDYRVIVHSACGADVTSSTATLTVNPATSITTQPTGITQCAGTTASLTVAANGTAPITYQWQKFIAGIWTALTNGGDVSGATATNLQIANIDNTDAGDYRVIVHSACGADVTSSTATLTVNSATSITSQPTGLTQCAGTLASFTVAANGTAPITYQWQKLFASVWTALTNGGDVSGATSTNLQIANIDNTDAGDYRVIVHSACGADVTSATVTLVVNNIPVIDNQPQSLTQCAGTRATFTVSAHGSGISYLWRKNNIPIIPAQTNNSLIINAITAADAGSYDVIVSNACGDVTSNAAILTVASLPSINSQPVDKDLCEGGDVSFSVGAIGTNITYQWRKDGVNIPGANLASLNLTGVTMADAGTYDVLVYGMCDTITSNPASLIVYPATVVDIVENDTLICAGSTMEFNADADGYGMLTYQWQFNYLGSWVDISDNSDYTGTNTPILSVIDVQASDTGLYRCVVSAGCGIVTSDPVRLDVDLIIATIGTPAPFMINSPTTSIEVGIKVTNHFLIFDLGFSLVAPDGTEVMLKYPEPSPCVYNTPVNINARFSNKLTAADTMDYCIPSGNITGTYGATGDWSLFNGMDPSNGAWQVRVYDQDKSVLDPDGYLTSATITFIDLDSDGDTAIVNYNSGTISEDIINPIASEMRPTTYIVPIRLMTTCFNSDDARAIVTVKGGVPPYTYEWSGPTAEDDVAQVDLGPGTYTVTVFDAIGCSATATVEVSAPDSIKFQDIQYTDSIKCNGSADGAIRAKAIGGTGSLTYILLPGNIASSVADSGVFLGLHAGDYILRVTDLNNCTFDTVIHIYQYPQLVVNIVTVPVIGAGLGSITLTASGGKAPYQYSIDNGVTLQNTGVFPGLPAAVYPVYVIDANGCIFTQDVDLNLQPLNVSVTKEDVSCFGLADGSFYLAMLDGVGPYTLTGSFTDTLVVPAGAFAFTGQTAGDYDVKIEDSEGRVFMDTIHILEPTQILATAVTTNATCPSVAHDGAIDMTITGGTGVFVIAWSNGATTEDLSNVSAGIYNVVINDANGCSSESFNFTVGSDNVVAVNAGPNQVVCPGVPFQLQGLIADSVNWSPETMVENPDVYNSWATIDETTLFTYTVFDKLSGCQASDTVRMFTTEPIGIEVMNSLNNEVIEDNVYLAQGDTFRMYATPGFQSYTWAPPLYISSTSDAQVTVWPVNDIIYTVTGMTAGGCPETYSVPIVIRRPIKIYSGFSPNGDAYNQTWVIENAEQYGNLIHVRVFNRWGELVYESRGYGGSDRWDGTRNGKLMPIGAYYYIVEIKDGISKPYTGTVTILR